MPNHAHVSMAGKFSHFIQRYFPFAALQFAYLRARLTSWLMLLFLAFLVTVSMTYPDVSGDFGFWVRHLWRMALLLHAAALAFCIGYSRRATLIMHGMRQTRRWIRAQIGAILAAEIPVASLAWIGAGLALGDGSAAFFNAAAMALFLAATTIAVCGPLQITLLSLAPAKSSRIRIVVSAPWIAIAWFLGFSGGLRAVAGEIPGAELCALAALIACQCALGFASDGEHGRSAPNDG